MALLCLVGRLQALIFDMNAWEQPTTALSDFFCRCTMVNLDGVMNNAAVAYYRVHGYDNDSIFQFARAQHVAYVWGVVPDEVRGVRQIRFTAGIFVPAQVTCSAHPPQVWYTLPVSTPQSDAGGGAPYG